MPPETMNDALVECVKACGGSKAVGVLIWPTLGLEVAQRRLLSCLNPDRNEKLGPDEVLHLLRLARERGCHVGMQFLTTELSYADPQPVEPKDEADQLRREFIESTRALAKMAERIEKLGALL